MPTNKNAQLRYQILDRCFSDFHHKFFIEDLLDKVNDVVGVTLLADHPTPEEVLLKFDDKPEWLRRQLKEKLQEILKKYSSVQEGCNIE